MSNTSDFIIENGVLTKYVGPGGDVVIPEGVTSIGNGAFKGCSSLTSVTIPEGVTSISYRAFCGCSSLTSVTIPESVTSIDSEAFSGTALYGDDCRWEKNVLYIGKHLIEGKKSLSGTYAIKKGTLIIGSVAFSGCGGLTSVGIPDGVTSIGSGAFRDCSKLKRVTIPDSVTEIGVGAFMGCSSLTSVTIPERVTNIGSMAFYGCRSLTKVAIPAAVTNIGSMAFSGCTRAKFYNISKEAANLPANFIIENGVLKKYSGLGGDVIIPAVVTSIGERAFYGSSLTSVTIPEGVTSIGECAFYGCSGLTSVTIPESVTSIGKEAFDGCKNLSSIFSNVKLSKDMFGKSHTKPIVTNDPGMLPASMKPLAAIGFAEQPDDPKSERGKAHLKYIKSNAAKLIKEALAHPALLRLMCENKLLTPEATEAYLAAAQEAGNAEITALLLDYQQNKLTGKEKEKAAQKAEAREEKVTDFVFSVEALEQLQGKVFVVTGKLNTFSSRDECKACLDACGAVLSETLNAQTDYLITNTPDSGSAKNKKAEALGVKKLSEADFNRLIGRKRE